MAIEPKRKKITMTNRPEMTTSQFWLSTLERAVKTFAQVAAAMLGTNAVGILDVDWQQIGSVAASAAVVSVLTSLASDRIGSTPGPSLVGETVVLPPEPLEVEMVVGEVPIFSNEDPNLELPLPTSTPAVYPLPDRKPAAPVGED